MDPPLQIMSSMVENRNPAFGLLEASWRIASTQTPEKRPLRGKAMGGLEGPGTARKTRGGSSEAIHHLGMVAYVTLAGLGLRVLGCE